MQIKPKLLWKNEGEPFKEMERRDREGGGRKGNRRSRRWQRDRKRAHQRGPPPPHAGELEPLTALPGQVNRGIGAGMRLFLVGQEEAVEKLPGFCEVLIPALLVFTF